MRNQSQEYDLATLIAAAGYDKGPGRLSESQYREGIEECLGLLGLQVGDSLLDLGCGPGALFLLLRELRNGSKVDGVDLSEGLLVIARQVSPDSKLCRMDLEDSESFEGTIEGAWDFVVALSVLQYLSLEAGLALFRNALRISTTAVLFSDIPDKERIEEAESLRVADYGEENYRRNFGGTAHTYFSLTAFKDVVEEPEFASLYAFEPIKRSIFPSEQGATRMTIIARRRHVQRYPQNPDTASDK